METFKGTIILIEQTNFLAGDLLLSEHARAHRQRGATRIKRCDAPSQRA